MPDSKRDNWNTAVAALTPEEQLAAVTAQAQLLGDAIGAVRALDHDMWDEIGEMFTCDEADAIVALLEGTFLFEHAEALLLAHATGDRPDDRHYELGQLARDIDDVTAMVKPPA